MNKLNKIRLPLDIMMTLVSIVLMGGNFLFPAEIVHEILGVGLFVLWGVHIALNRLWYSAIFRGKYNPLYVVSPVKKKKQERSFGNLPTLIFLDNEHVHPVRSMDSPKFFLSNVEHNTLFLKVAK